MYLFPNLSVPKAICLSMLSSAVTVGYIIHDNNTTNIASIPTTTYLKKSEPQYEEIDKGLLMGWWTQQ